MKILIQSHLKIILFLLITLSYYVSITCAGASRSKRSKTKSADNSVWTLCSQEGQMCMNSKAPVKYGIKDKWVTLPPSKYSRVTLPCTNSYAGRDPLYGTKKICLKKIQTNFPVWVYLCSEGETCIVPANYGSVEVKYGNGRQFSFRKISGRFPCNAHFLNANPRTSVKACFFRKPRITKSLNLSSNTISSHQFGRRTSAQISRQRSLSGSRPPSKRAGSFGRGPGSFNSRSSSSFRGKQSFNPRNMPQPMALYAAGPKKTQAKSSTKTDTDWIFCANNDEVCKSEGKNYLSLVRYGHGNSWVYSVLSEDITCNDSSFNKVGGGSSNKCYYHSDASARIECAKENEECSYNGSMPASVYYMEEGSDMKDCLSYVVKKISGVTKFKCNSEYFNKDPAPNSTKKRCYLSLL